MEIALLISGFFTCFLLLLVISPSHKKDSEEEEKEQVTFSDKLKQVNQKTKQLILPKKRSKKRNSLADKLTIAGVGMSPEEFTVLRVLFSIILAGVTHLLSGGNILYIMMAFIVGYVLSIIWLSRKQRLRIKAFNDNLPNMITSMAGSLKAGFSFLQSLQMVAEESYSPVKDELDYVIKSMQYGKSTEEALNEWKRRMPSKDLELLIDGILVQRQIGGNLVYLLNKIVDTIRGRTKIQNQVRTLTSQGRLSGYIIGFLPVGLASILFVINPSYILALFYHPIGQIMLGLGVMNSIIGFVMIRKITTIEV